MDGEAVSILLSENAQDFAPTRVSAIEESESPRSRSIGIDPGRENAITAVDHNGRYMLKQQLFEIGSYREVLERAKRKTF